MLGLPLLALLGAALVCAEANVEVLKGTWEIVAEQGPERGDAGHPSVRYSACAVSARHGVIVSHGYFHDHDRNTATWKSDTWLLHLHDGAGNEKRGQWQLLYNDADGPSPRMSHSCVLHDDHLVLYGGSQGGGMVPEGYYVANTFSDVWEFDLVARTWTQLPQYGLMPPSREHHSAVMVQGRMWVYGGVDKSDFWVFDLIGGKGWAEIQSDGNNPKQRFGHASVPSPDGEGLYLLGGQSRFPVVRYNDVWYYNIIDDTWRELAVSGMGPGRRSGFGAVLLPGQQLLVHGGTRDHRCFDDTHILDLARRRWELLEPLSVKPIPRYKHSMVVVNKCCPTQENNCARDVEIVVFGGESMKPYMYHNGAVSLEIHVSSGDVMTATPRIFNANMFDQVGGAYLGLGRTVVLSVCLLICCLKARRQLQRLLGRLL